MFSLDELEWGNVAVPTVQYTHGMLSCSAFTGVPLITLLQMCGADTRRGRFVLAEGADGSSMTRSVPMALIEFGEVLGWPTARTARRCTTLT